MEGGNSSNIYIEKDYRIVISIIGVLTSLGIPLNVAVIFVFCRLYKKDPTTFNLMMISNSLGDFLLIAIAGPTRITAFIKGVAELGPLECKIYGSWVHLTSVASLSHLVLLAVERYWVIKQGKITCIMPFWQRLLIPLSAWFYAIFWAALPLLGWSEYAPESQHVGCAPKWRSVAAIDVSYNVTLMLSEFFVPVIIIGIFYKRLFKEIKKRQPSASQSDFRLQKIQQHVLKMTILMVVAFVFSWLPYTFCCLWAMFTQKDLLSSSYGAVPSVFAKSSVIWNPIIYGTKHRKFKAEVKRIWGKARGRRTSNIQTETVNDAITVEQ